MSIRDAIGAHDHEEYVTFLARAVGDVEDAIRSMDPMSGRIAIQRARNHLASADDRLSPHAPDTTPLERKERPA